MGWSLRALIATDRRLQRHISVCLPPLYRPPNPPPDLQALINEALHQAAGPKPPSSLLAYHVNVLNDASDNYHELPPEYQVLSPYQAGKKVKGKAAVGLRKVVSVKPPEDRGDHWDEEVDLRLGEILGRRDQRRSSVLRDTSVSPQPRTTLSPASSPFLPSTQPMGDSCLASAYTRARPSSSSGTGLGSDSASMVADSEDEENSPPMPPSKQRRASVSSDDGDTEESRPFRRGGGSRADGDLPSDRHTAKIEGGYGKRIRDERGLAGELRLHVR